MAAREDLDHPGAFRAVHAIRDAVPTRVHAAMLFDQVADLLGDAAWTETYDDGSRRVLFRREQPGSDVIFPWPMLTLGMRGRLGAVALVAAPEGAPTEPAPRPGRSPRLRDLGPGELMVHDGQRHATITYGDDGRWKEVTRGGPKEQFMEVVDTLAAATANPVELLAHHVAALDIARHGPGRAVVPAPLPGGVAGVWNGGLSTLREMAFEGRVPGEAHWVAVDAYGGAAFACGATRDATLERWRNEVGRVRPAPPAPSAPRSPLPEESVETKADPERRAFAVQMTLRGPTSDVAAPEPTSGNTPGILTELTPEPAYAPPAGRWVRLIGKRGTTSHAARREDPSGFTLIGDRLAAVLSANDLDDLDVEIDEVAARADADFEAMLAKHPFRDVTPPPGAQLPQPPKWSIRMFDVVDPDTGRPVTPRALGCNRVANFRPQDLDGDRLRWRILRVRPIGD